MIFILWISIALFQLESVASLNCYECTYSEYFVDDIDTEILLNEYAGRDEECWYDGDDYLSSSQALSVNCSSSQVCSKTYYSVDMIYSGHEAIVDSWSRGCVDATEVDMGCHESFDQMFGNYSEVLGGEVLICSCDTEKCNAASSVTVGYMALMLSAIVAFWKL